MSYSFASHRWRTGSHIADILCHILDSHSSLMCQNIPHISCQGCCRTSVSQRVCTHLIPIIIIQSDRGMTDSYTCRHSTCVVLLETNIANIPVMLAGLKKQ